MLTRSWNNDQLSDSDSSASTADDNLATHYATTANMALMMTEMLRYTFNATITSNLQDVATANNSKILADMDPIRIAAVIYSCIPSKVEPSLASGLTADSLPPRYFISRPAQL